MSRALLDINVLLALLDADHIDHRVARRWIESEIAGGWASCAITENGFARIISQPSYPSPISPSKATDLLAEAAGSPHHEFWECDVSILDRELFDCTRIHGPLQVTDAYLLGLASLHKGCFVTFDQSVPLSAVKKATPKNLVVLKSLPES